MKKVIYSLFVIIAAMVTFAGCAKQEIDAPATPETKTVQFFANSIETKTEFGTPTEGVYPTLWSEGDKVDVSVNFAKEKSSSEVECSDDFKSARFEVDLSGTEMEAPYTFYSVSPVDRLRGISSQYKRFYVEILSEQTPLATSVDKDAQLLFAKSATTPDMPSSVELTYQHLTAYGKFSLVNLDAESVSSIILEAEFDIAGKWDYFLEDGSFVVRSGNGSKSITLTTSSTTDIWFACAPVDMTGKKMTLTVTTEKGNFVKVLNFPADKERKFEAGKISKFTVDMADIKVEGSEEPEQPGETTEAWTLVTDASTLAVGDKVVIAAAEYNFALSTDQRSNNRNQASITKNSNTITLTDDVQVMTLEAGTIAGTYAFNTGSGYLYAASSAKNYLKTESSLTANSSWVISIGDNGVATIKAQGTNTRNWLRYNSTNDDPGPIFSCYSTGQKDVSIYRLEGANEGGGETPEPEQPKTLVSIAVSGQTTSYTVGDTFAFDGTVTATYSDESTAEVEPTSVSTPNMTTEGEQAVTVTYTEGEETKIATYTITVTAAVEPEDPSEPIVATIEQFLEAEDSETVWYQLTGKISNITSTTYGNFDLTDETGTVYVYGLKASKDAGKQTFSSLGLKEGDTVTLIGNRYTFVYDNGDSKDEVTNAYYVSHVPAPYLTVSTSNISVAATATSAEFTVDTNVDWGVSCSTATAAKSENKVTVAFVANETAEAVVHKVVVTSQLGTETVTITQAAASQGGGDLVKGDTYSYEISNKSSAANSWNKLLGGTTNSAIYISGFSDNFVEMGELTWGISASGADQIYFSGQQIGASSNYITSFELETDSYQGAVESITLSTCSNAGNTTIEVYVGDKQLGSTITLSNSSSVSDIVFTGTSLLAGKIYIKYTVPTQKKNIKISNIKIN